MDEYGYKEVRFDYFCNICKYNDVKEVRNPCNECLEVGMRDGTNVPIKYEERKKE